MPTNEAEIRFLIEGRTFIQDAPTFEQELYIMDKATDAGFTDAGGLALDAKGNMPLLARQMLMRAYKSGHLYHLMAALLNEEGVEWSEEEAEKNSAFFRKVKDPESKANLQVALAASVVAFFESAVTSGEISNISSAVAAEPLDVSGLRVQPKRKPMNSLEAEALFHSVNTNPLSEASRTIIGSTRGPSSSLGKSARDSSPSKRSSKKK